MYLYNKNETWVEINVCWTRYNVECNVAFALRHCYQLVNCHRIENKITYCII